MSNFYFDLNGIGAIGLKSYFLENRIPLLETWDNCDKKPCPFYTRVVDYFGTKGSNGLSENGKNLVFNMKQPAENESRLP